MASLRSVFPLAALAAASALLCAASAAHAQARPASPSASTAPTALQATSVVTRHRVVPGDTLEQLARYYLGDGTLWPQVQRHNQVASPYRLQPGSMLELPNHLMRTVAASVDFLQGNVTLLPPPSRSSAAPTAPQPLEPGQLLPEGSQLKVAPDAFVSIKLADGSLLKVQANSDVLLQQLRRKGRTGSLASVVDLQSGALEALVPPQRQQPASFEVRTPSATSSVRGTEFGVYLTPSGSTATAVLQGAVQVQATHASAAQARLAKGQGSAISTSGALQQAALLPALPSDALPQRAEDAQWLEVPLPTPAAGTGYLVQVSSDAQGQQVVRNGRFMGATPRFSAVPDGHYFVRVQPIDTLGIPGYSVQAPLTVKAHPVPPLYQTPPGALLPSDAVAVQCTPVHGASAYRIQIAASAADFAAPLRDEVVREQCALQAGTLPVGHYQWRAASIRTLANGEADQGPFAAPQALQVAARPAVPDAAALQWHNQGATPAMHWKGEPGQSWRIVVARTPEATDPVLDVRVDQPQWHATDLGTGQYYLRIQTRDASGLESPLSAARQFTIAPWVRDGFGNPLRGGQGQDVLAQ